MQSALEPARFSAETTTEVFHLAVFDHCSVLLLPSLLTKLRKAAPNIHLRVRPKSNIRISMQLDAGEIDSAIGVVPTVPSRFSKEVLFEESYVCVMRKNHPRALEPLTKADYLTARHLAITHWHLLAKLNIEREIIATSNHYVLAPDLLREQISC